MKNVFCTALAATMAMGMFTSVYANTGDEAVVTTTTEAAAETEVTETETTETTEAAETTEVPAAEITPAEEVEVEEEAEDEEEEDEPAATTGNFYTDFEAALEKAGLTFEKKQGVDYNPIPGVSDSYVYQFKDGKVRVFELIENESDYIRYINESYITVARTAIDVEIVGEYAIATADAKSVKGVMEAFNAATANQ